MSDMLLFNIHTILVPSWYQSFWLTTMVVRGCRVQEFKRGNRTLKIDKMRRQIQQLQEHLE
jgi:hypothetical protein